MDVCSWLAGLGLDHYVPAFRANDIDAEVLFRLTAEDLIALGVASVGHRRKLLDAIAGLRERTAPEFAQAFVEAAKTATPGGGQSNTGGSEGGLLGKLFGR